MKLLSPSGWMVDPYVRAEDVSAGEATLLPLSLVEAALT